MNKNAIEKSFKIQQEFYKSGKTFDYSFRKQQLLNLKNMIEENVDFLSDALYKDYKKPETETYLTEIAWVLSEIKYMLKKLKSWMKKTKVKTSLFHFPAKSYIVNEPYGNALIISPWNYPVQLTLSPLVGAMAAGNCAVIKPSEFVPNTAKALEELFSKYFDSGYITVINGGVEVSQTLLSLDFDYAFFTGSPGVGKIVMEKCAENLTPVTLELGGKSPCIVSDKINVKTTARRIVWGKFTNAGQTCIAPDYLFVHESVKEKLVEEINNQIKDFFPPNPQESDEYSRIVNAKHFKRVVSYIKESKIISGGGFNEKDNYIEPTLVEPSDMSESVMCDEIFGPVLPVIEYSDIKEVINSINSGSKPLALYLFTKDKKLQRKVTRETSSGGMCINGTLSHILSHKLPFGGVGNSGIGKYFGKFSFDTFSNLKSVMKKSFKFDLRMQYQPYKKRINFLKKFLKWVF